MAKDKKKKNATNEIGLNGTATTVSGLSKLDKDEMDAVGGGLFYTIVDKSTGSTVWSGWGSEAAHLYLDNHPNETFHVRVHGIDGGEVRGFIMRRNVTRAEDWVRWKAD